jgi:predicted GIY-YIG superfamily endonuclease
LLNNITYIYLIKSSINNYYKIGLAKDINKRIKTLQTGNAEELILITSYKTNPKIAPKLEFSLHNYYNLKRIKSEWFNLNDDDVNKFMEICEKNENNLIYLSENPL